MINYHFLENEEGKRLWVYDDATGQPLKRGQRATGNPTVGVGHKLLSTESFPEGITEEKCRELLEHDVAIALGHIKRLVHVPLNDNQLTALVSLVFNCGQAPLMGTIGRFLNAGKYKEAAEFFLQWDHVGQKELLGLMRRRRRERDLFMTPVSEEKTGHV